MKSIAPVAVITGAASGIGAASARTLAGAGFHVAILDRDLDGGREVADDLPGEALAVSCDVTDSAAVDRAVSAASEAWGRIDAVVACAGVAIAGDVPSLSDDKWLASIDVNLNGVFRLARATLPRLVDAGGSFTAIASDAGVRGSQHYSSYAAAKHGVIGLIRTMALEWGGLGVRSNAICPGFVETPMASQFLGDATPDEVERYRRAVPLGRYASPSEVAVVVRHLTLEATYANGTIYALDGGTTAGVFHPGER